MFIVLLKQICGYFKIILRVSLVVLTENTLNLKEPFVMLFSHHNTRWQNIYLSLAFNVSVFSCNFLSLFVFLKERKLAIDTHIASGLAYFLLFPLSLFRFSFVLSFRFLTLFVIGCIFPSVFFYLYHAAEFTESVNVIDLCLQFLPVLKSVYLVLLNGIHDCIFCFNQSYVKPDSTNRCVMWISAYHICIV